MPRTLDLANVEVKLRKVCNYCGNALLPVENADFGTLLSCKWCKVSYRIVTDPRLRQIGEYFAAEEEKVLEEVGHGN